MRSAPPSASGGVQYSVIGGSIPHTQVRAAREDLGLPPRVLSKLARLSRD